MNLIKKALGIAAVTACALTTVGCGDDSKDPEWDWDKPTTSDDNSIKPRYIWIDAAANFYDYANSKENIARDMKKLANVGITDVVVDVRPTTGDILFASSVGTQVDKLAYWADGGQYTYLERTADWDYLQAFIDAGHAEGLKVHAAINTFVGGKSNSYGLGNQGMLYRESSKKDWATVINTTSGLVNVMDSSDDSYSTKFLNPSNPEVKSYLLALLADLAKYKVDGIFLDRCRYNDFQTDFSDASRKAFESYIGTTVSNFPSDCIAPGTKYNELPSTLPKYFKQWLTFRAKTIHDFIVDASATVKKVNPDIQFGVYVGAWYSTYYEVGVNWASPNYPTATYYPKWAESDYQKYGYADKIDYLLLGAYASVTSIYGTNDWTMQGFCQNARTRLRGDVKFAGGPDVGNSTGWTNGGKSAEVTKTVDACINAADGYFLFDLVHVKKYDYWSGLKEGIDNYLKSVEKK